MADRQLLTRRRVVTGAVGGSMCAVAFASPSLRDKLANMAEDFSDAFTSPYDSLETGDHNSWGAQKGQTFTTADGHQLLLVQVVTFKPFGRTAPGVTRTRAFQAEFQLVGGGALGVEKIQQITDSEGESMDLYLTGSNSTPGRVRALFN